MKRQQVLLTSELFQAALARHVDENKATLDPLMKQQLESSTFAWKDDDGEAENQQVSDDKPSPLVQPNPPTADILLGTKQHFISGTLTWTGEYAQVELHIQTDWQSDAATKNAEERQSLSTTGRVASCRFLKNPIKPGSKKDRVDRKIRSRVIKRLEKDDYISKLLRADNNNDSLVLFEARILLSGGGPKHATEAMEERVDTNAVTAEGIRRAVWSSSSADDGALDLFDLLLNLPWLPCQQSKNDDGQSSTTTPLANRARLRLLEDAMCEACEQQGDGEIISGLEIANHTGDSKVASSPVPAAPQNKKRQKS